MHTVAAAATAAASYSSILKHEGSAACVCVPSNLLKSTDRNKYEEYRICGRSLLAVFFHRVAASSSAQRTCVRVQEGPEHENHIL